MKYPLSEKFCNKQIDNMMMGPNPVKLCEELLVGSKIRAGEKVCDLGSGQGVTSAFMAKMYGYNVFACDLWSEPSEHAQFFESQGVADKVTAVKADATDLPFDKQFFDAVVCVDSYNYFGRDEQYLDQKLLPFVKKGGYVYIAVPGMKKDCHEHLPAELLLSWTPEQLAYMRDLTYWSSIVHKSKTCAVQCVCEMQSNEEVWNDWLQLDNEYAVSDRKSMNAGGGKYLNFIKIVLKKL